jgi:hypothetical protein
MQLGKTCVIASTFQFRRHFTVGEPPFATATSWTAPASCAHSVKGCPPSRCPAGGAVSSSRTTRCWGSGTSSRRPPGRCSCGSTPAVSGQRRRTRAHRASPRRGPPHEDDVADGSRHRRTGTPGTGRVDERRDRLGHDPPRPAHDVHQHRLRAAGRLLGRRAGRPQPQPAAGAGHRPGGGSPGSGPRSPPVRSARSCSTTADLGVSRGGTRSSSRR